MAYFMDFEFNTGSVTLSPRPETEILVEKAVELLSERSKRGLVCDILDIGTGCGNIAISLTKYIPSSKIVALDISDTALRVARENAARYDAGKRIEFIKSDLFENIGGKYRNFFDLIISNPPYVSLYDFSSLPQGVRDEPYIALYGGRDGTEFFQKIAEVSRAYLKTEGLILMEMGYGQVSCVKAMLEHSGLFCDIEIYKDYSGIDRIVKAKNG